MKIIVVGDFVWPWYQEACSNALEELGHEVIRYGWFDIFWKRTKDKTEPKFKSIYHLIQFRFCIGPLIFKIKYKLLNIAKFENPTIIFFYNVRIIDSKFIKRLKNELPNSILCQYSNDNPFSFDAKKGFWKNYINSIPFFDVHFAFRKSNFNDYNKYGAKHVALLRAYFIPEEDFEIEYDLIPDKFKCDVVFAGHYENDGRLDYLESICKAGYKLNLFGGGWNKIYDKLGDDSLLKEKFPIYPVVGDEYRYAICGAKFSLCFLSKLNQDTYTRRNFQIPAMKGALLCQETSDLTSLFIKNKEICFFNTIDEMLNYADLLNNNEKFRNQIKIGGYNRVYSDGHDVKSRMLSILHYLKSNNFIK